MTSPDADQAAETVKAVQGNAKALGLVWNMVPATVVDATIPSAITVAMDGDPQTPIPAISLIGFLTAGRRVFVIETPGGGLYIVGFGGPELHGVMRGETGTATVSFTTLTLTTVAVTFARPFIVAPNVHTNINSGVGTTAGWSSRAFSISTTGFTLFLYAAAGGAAVTWSNVGVQWSAFVNP